MSSFAALGEDSLVDALLMEVAGLLARLIERGEGGIIDLRGLPLSPSCREDLKQRLGHGEINVTLDAAGRSEIFETGFPGVWWRRRGVRTRAAIAATAPPARPMAAAMPALPTPIPLPPASEV